MDREEFEQWYGTLNQAEREVLIKFMSYLLGLDPRFSETYAPFGKNVYELCKEKIIEFQKKAA